jgi:hypothetical protein
MHVGLARECRRERTDLEAGRLERSGKVDGVHPRVELFAVVSLKKVLPTGRGDESENIAILGVRLRVQDSRQSHLLFCFRVADLALNTYSVENGHRMSQRKHGIGSEGTRVRKGERGAVWPRLRRSRCAIQRTLQRGRKMRILLQREGTCQQGRS